jgi:hypothetical protein
VSEGVVEEAAEDETWELAVLERGVCDFVYVGVIVWECVVVID